MHQALDTAKQQLSLRQFCIDTELCATFSLAQYLTHLKSGVEEFTDKLLMQFSTMYLCST